MRLLILFLALPIFAQDSAPQWLEESWRAARYPSAEWHTGFARNKIESQPNSVAYEAIEKEAQNKLSQSITVRIQSVSATERTSEQTQSGKNINETINRNYRQEITTASSIVLAKLETKTYFDKQSGYIYGFAAVKKKDLADFYRSSINTLFAFAEKEFSLAEQLAEQGKKKTALDKIQSAEDSLKNVGYWASFLQAVESDNSYTAKETALWQRASNMKMRLQNATTVYLDISGSEEDFSDLNERLAAQMQEKGCNCIMAEEKENADYSITIKTKLSRCSEASLSSPVFCWANAIVVVNNIKHKKPVNVKIPEAKGGWIKGNKDKAIYEAFKKLTDSMAEKINQTINQ